MDEYYQSTVVMFATSQHSIGEQFFEETKKNDLLAYGETEDASGSCKSSTRTAFGTGSSRSSTCSPITTSTPRVRRPGGHGVDVRKQRERQPDAVRVHQSVRVDTDPFLARDMANDMAHLVDSIANSMRNDRARVQFGLEHLDQTTAQIAEAEDSLATLHSMGIYDFEAQVEGLTAQYGMALASNNGAARAPPQRLGATWRPGQRIQQPLGLPRSYEQKALLKSGWT